MAASDLKYALVSLHSLFSSGDLAEEADEHAEEPSAAFPLALTLVAYAVSFGFSSIPFLLLAILSLLSLYPAKSERVIQGIRISTRNCLWLLGVWWIISLWQCDVSPQMLMVAFSTLSIGTALKVDFRYFFALASTMTVWSVIVLVKSSTVPSNYIFMSCCAFSTFSFEAEVVTRRWYTTKKSAKAELKRNEQLSLEKLEKKGAVKSAVEKLFLKAFGNYDQFSREVSKLVKEVEQNLPREAHDALRKKEVDFSAFELERKLASGGFCTVFRGRMKHGNRQCAVKSFSSADRLDTAGLRGLVNEVVVLTTLEHKSIVKVLGYCWAPQVCLVMEYMPKGTLHDMLAYKSLTISWESPLMILAIQIADALAYLHTRNPPIIHRDIKARNILMKDFRTCKLADFGLMVLEGSSQARAGTIRYVAPEVVNGADTSQQNTTRADIWSFGVCLWEMATRAQFAGLPPSYLVFGPAPRTLFVSKLPYAIPNVVYDVIEECLRPDPETRRITAKECHDRLTKGLGTLRDKDSYFNEESHPRPTIINPLMAGNMDPNDLSVDASATWRNEAIWTSGNWNNGGGSLSQGALQEPSQTLDGISNAYASGINSRLRRAESSNSRQLARLSEEIPPPSQSASLSTVPHERLSILSRLAVAENACKSELKAKSGSRQLELGNSCPLLQQQFEVLEEQPAPNLSLDPTINGDSLPVPVPDNAMRLSLLSRLALAENRTQQEAQSKFASSGSLPFLTSTTAKTPPRVSNSRLLNTLATVEDELEEQPSLISSTGDVRIHQRLGLLARLADSEADAKQEFGTKIVSKSLPLQDSCPLLRVAFVKSDDNENFPDDEASSVETNTKRGSTSSFDSRFLNRLGAVPTSWGGGRRGSDESTTTSGESRFLGRLGGDDLVTTTAAAKVAEALPVLPITVPEIEPLAPSKSISPPSPFSPTASARASRLGRSNIEQSPSNSSSPIQKKFQSKVELRSSSSASPTAMKPTNADMSSSAPTIFAESSPPFQGGLLARLAAAEAMAASDLAVKVKQGSTSVSSSLLAFPVDEKPELEDEDDDGDEGEEQDSCPAETSSLDSGSPSAWRRERTPPHPDHRPGGNPLRPVSILSRLAQAEALASSEFQTRVTTGRTNISSSLLSFPIDQGLENDEDDQDDEEEETKNDLRSSRDQFERIDTVDRIQSFDAVERSEDTENKIEVSSSTIFQNPTFDCEPSECATDMVPLVSIIHPVGGVVSEVNSEAHDIESDANQERSVSAPAASQPASPFVSDFSIPRRTATAPNEDETSGIRDAEHGRSRSSPLQKVLGHSASFPSGLSRTTLRVRNTLEGAIPLNIEFVAKQTVANQTADNCIEGDQ